MLMSSQKRAKQTDRGSLSMALNLLSHVYTQTHTDKKMFRSVGNVLYGIRHLTTCGVSSIFL